MNRFFLNEITRRDFWYALGLWAGLEVFSFILCPLMGLFPLRDRSLTWFLISLPLGVSGAFLVAASSRFVVVTNHRRRSLIKTLEVWVAQAIGWMGLLGIAFPLLMVALEFGARLMRELQRMPT